MYSLMLSVIKALLTTCKAQFNLLSKRNFVVYSIEGGKRVFLLFLFYFNTLPMDVCFCFHFFYFALTGLYYGMYGRLNRGVCLAREWTAVPRVNDKNTFN